jgi:beta-mannosidase
MDLSGVWRAAPGDDEMRRRFAEDGFDDDGWADLPVPGHWRSAPAFEDSDGPILHRCAFEAPVPEPGRRSFVVLEGCFYQADVWLDGSYLGDTEGYFLPHAFEVTDQLRARGEHVLAVDLTCTPPPEKAARRDLTGVFHDRGHLDPEWNPGGIWRPVRIVETGQVRIASLRVRCTDATADRARLQLTAGLDALGPGDVELRTTVARTPPAGGQGIEHRHRTQVTAGPNQVSWQVEVAEPALWWPRALCRAGEVPALVDVVVEASVLRAEGGRTANGAPAGRALSDTARRTTGLRQVRMARWVLEVNGERLFVKGASLGPARMALGEAPAAEVEADVALAQEAGLDLLRVHAHVGRPELYEAADRSGLLLWQDLPLHRGYPRNVRRQAVRQTEAAVDLLAHHPSIALWCADNEPTAEFGGTRRPPDVVSRFVRGQVLPGWSRSVLVTSLSGVLAKADGSRPVVPPAGLLPHPAWGTDTHLSFGWHHGDERDLPTWLRRLPVLARFVGEFGAQAVPPTAAWMEPERWPDLDWERLVRSHGMDKATFDRRVPPGAFATFEAWRDATQEHQATVLRHHVEELRRLKYRPAGGFCQFLLADGHPAVSCSVVDHERAPKAGFAALREACAPVIVVADRPAASYRPGTPVALDVHVVSDLRRPIFGCTLHAALGWRGGSHRWGFVGEVAADTVARVGTLSFVVPEAPGPLTLDLRLEGPAAATATYRSEIVPAR